MEQTAIPIIQTNKRRNLCHLFTVFLVVIAFLLVITLAGAWGMFGTQIKAAGTVEKLEDCLYTLAYQGDYGLDELMAQGGVSDSGELAAYIASFLSHGFYTPETEEIAPDFGCSTLAVSSPEGGVLFGRNYDWEPCKTMIVRCDPKDGYDSVSTVCLDFLGFGEDWVPDGGMMDRFMALAAVYIPLDGVNEKGLCVADLMAGDKEETHQDTEHPDVTTTLSIRLLLDRAATVEEAVALLERLDMNSDIGAAHHLAIADATGNSVVVEYVDGNMIVTPTPVVTNHYLSAEKQGVGSEQSHRRFDTLTWLYEETDGVMSAETLRNALASVAQSNYPHVRGDCEGTQWSLVLNPSGGGYQLYWRENYEKAYTITIPAMIVGESVMPPVTLQTPPPAEDSERLAAYQFALEQISFEHVYPDGTDTGFDGSIGFIEENHFALRDVTGDGEDELIVQFVTAPMAGNAETVYTWREGALTPILTVFPTVTYYENGMVKELWSHGDYLTGEEWPYNLYQYDAASGRYDLLAEVNMWSRAADVVNYKGDPYPEDIDAEGAGMVYILTRDGVTETVSKSDYEGWLADTLKGAAELDIPYQAMTEENIKAVAGR